MVERDGDHFRHGAQRINEARLREIGDLDEVQQQLCEAVGPGIAYPELHRRTHRAVAERLVSALSHRSFPGALRGLSPSLHNTTVLQMSSEGRWLLLRN